MDDNKSKNPFIKKCLEEFKYLETDFGFKVISTKNYAYGVGVTYVNNTTGIEIRYEPRECYIFIELNRLMHGKIPEYDQKNVFGLDNILIFRSPTSIIKPKPLKAVFTIADQNKMLKRYAKALRKYASDVLNGDFSIFPELGKIVKQRLADYKKMAKNLDTLHNPL